MVKKNLLAFGGVVGLFAVGTYYFFPSSSSSSVTEPISSSFSEGAGLGTQAISGTPQYNFSLPDPNPQFVNPDSAPIWSSESTSPSKKATQAAVYELDSATGDPIASSSAKPNFNSNEFGASYVASPKPVATKKQRSQAEEFGSDAFNKRFNEVFD